jgi:hypothetical protein
MDLACITMAGLRASSHGQLSINVKAAPAADRATASAALNNRARY